MIRMAVAGTAASVLAGALAVALGWNSGHTEFSWFIRGPLFDLLNPVYWLSTGVGFAMGAALMRTARKP